MSTQYNIPVGAQHISLLEPLHFKFTTENEKIIKTEANVGYVHRGIEQAWCSKFKFRQVSFVVGRVCGLCQIFTDVSDRVGQNSLSFIVFITRCRKFRF